jgi:hypothetical protein
VFLYSLRSDLTGFASAARTDCQLMVAMAMTTATAPASTNMSAPIDQGKSR